MNIGIIGLGVVGSAIKTGFEKLGHTILCHDLKLSTTVKDTTDSEIIFLCVPTPQNNDGSCDVSVIENIIEQLNQLSYRGIIAIKSTVECGFTQIMIKKYIDLTICFVPEFLRERCAEYDFISNHNLLAVGSDDPVVYEKIVKIHGSYPKHTVHIKPTEAEILKYYLNLYAATRVTFANVFFEICEKMDCDYTAIKNAYIKIGRHGDMYLDVNSDLRGYGGTCLPKDTRAIIKLLEKLNLDFKLLKAVDDDNSKLETTVFNNMRKA